MPESSAQPRPSEADAVVAQSVRRLDHLEHALRSKRYTVQVMPFPERWEIINVATGEIEDTIYVGADRYFGAMLSIRHDAQKITDYASTLLAQMRPQDEAARV